MTGEVAGKKIYPPPRLIHHLFSTTIYVEYRSTNAITIAKLRKTKKVRFA
jgi:hypothetical protein